jgi:DNA primase
VGKDSTLTRRLVIPYTWQGEIVGFTARTIANRKPKYLNTVPTDYVFGIDTQDQFAQFGIVVEGALDAIAIGGIGVLTNEVNETKARIINALGKKIIVVPDRNKGGPLIDAALTYNWSVSFPEWEKDVNDCAQAMQRYGKLYTFRSILAGKVDSKIQIEVLRRLNGYK